MAEQIHIRDLNTLRVRGLIQADRLARATRRLARRLRDGEVGDPLRSGPWHWPPLLAWSGLWFAAKAVRGGQSWHFAVQGAHLLWNGAGHGRPPGGLHLFAHYPRLQSGPLTFALAEPLTRLSPHDGVVAAELAMSLLGLLSLLALERAAFALRPDVPRDRIRWTTLGGGMLLIPIWALTGVWFAHLDDVLALAFAALAVWAAAAGRAGPLGACVAFSVDSKPWAAAFLPLLCALPGPVRRDTDRRRAAAVCLVLVAAAWLPFLLADPGSVEAARFTIANVPDSALRALGVHDPRTPGWDRSAQIAVGCALGALAVWRGRWPAAVLLGVCARIALEPNDYAYYFAGLLLGALCWDLLAAVRPKPLTTLSVTALIFALPALGVSARLDGNIKLWTMLGVAFAALLAPAARTPKAAAEALPAPAAASFEPLLLAGLGDDLRRDLGGHGLVAQVFPSEDARAV